MLAKKEIVLLDWMKSLPWKQQSALLSSLRGPDTYSPNIKRLSRWLRKVTQHNADPSHPYMRKDKLPSLDELEGEFESCSVHYVIHLLWGLEIIGYNHPNKGTARTAENYYRGLVEKVLFLNPETRSQLGKRLKDKI